MIIHIERGKLGNQFLQYLGYRRFFPDQRLYMVGCEELHSVTEGLQCHFLRAQLGGQPGRYLLRVLKGLGIRLARMQVLGSIIEDSSSENYVVIKRRGIIPKLYIATDVFFQHKGASPVDDEMPDLKAGLLQQASNWLLTRGVDLVASNLVFVQVRRGDYLEWPSKETPVVLPLDYYNKLMQQIQQADPEALFVVLSDDYSFAKNCWADSPSVIISDNPPEIDLAIMSLCSAGILSASSFAWVGAAYSRQRAQMPGPYYAPKYWAGHRFESWYPPHFESDWLTYV